MEMEISVSLLQANTSYLVSWYSANRLPCYSTEESLIPIQLPCSPNEYCHSNITTITCRPIREEFLRGHYLTKDVLSPTFDWKGLFEPFSYAYHYARFFKIRLSSSDREEFGVWVGWLKSRLCCLLVKVEDLLGFCYPNPTEYVDATLHAPNTVFFWGLTISRSHKIDVEAIKEEFEKKIKSGREGPIVKIELSVAKASELPDMDPERTDACSWVPDGNGQRIPVASNYMAQKRRR